MNKEHQMKINYDRLNLPGKIYYWIEETWTGLDPRSTYTQQASSISKSLDNMGYIEKGWKDGIVVMAFFIPDRNGVVQLVCVDTPEELNSYVKKNEAHVRMAPANRKVSQMISWEAGKDSFLTMIARTKVRASYEQQGLRQPSEEDLEVEAQKVLEEELS